MSVSGRNNAYLGANGDGVNVRGALEGNDGIWRQTRQLPVHKGLAMIQVEPRFEHVFTKQSVRLKILRRC